MFQGVDAVPPPPTPQLPVFRGPPQLHGDYEYSLLQPVFHPVNTHIKVVEGGTAFLQCRIRYYLSIIQLLDLLINH